MDIFINRLFLSFRKYSDAKLNQNMECEIMQVILEEVRELYPKNYLELESNIEAQYKHNLALVLEILD